MRGLRVLLALASVVLPPAHRDRWREESLAVLLAVSGPRRWWFALDVAVKAPLLARALRAPVAPPARWLSALAGVVLLLAAAAPVAALALASVIGEDAAELLLLTTPCGLLGVVALHSQATARSYGGGALPRLSAGLLTVLAGTGPVAVGGLSVVTGSAAVALLGALVPGVWLVVVSGTALLRRTQPPALATSGVLAGTGLLALLVCLQLLTHAPGSGALASLLGLLSLLLLAPAWTVWSVWTGLRLVRGRTEPALV